MSLTRREQREAGPNNKTCSTADDDVFSHFLDLCFCSNLATEPKTRRKAYAREYSANIGPRSFSLLFLRYINQLEF
jgi:hypothetical protein